MIDRFFSRRRIVARLESGPVRRELELFASVLREEGYAAETGRQYIRSAHRFGGWLEGIGLGIKGCHEQAIGLYIWQLGRRRHPRWDRGRLPEAAEGVRKFVSVLRQRDMMAPAAPPPQTDTERWLHAFDSHLEHVAGVAERTREQYLGWCRRFMAVRFGDGQVDWGGLSAEDLIRFVQVQAQRLRPSACGSGATFVTALRSLLRFLVCTGAVRRGLESAIPVVRRAKLASLPRHLSAADVARTLATCDERTVIGRRDRAVLMLLSRLGLRSSEVVRLGLDDIDWREGWLAVRRCKSRRERRLPVPQDVGQAVAAYLRNGRPRSTHRTVFLRCIPPYRPLQPISVTALARTHLRLAGVEGHLLGAHLLRHTVATHMVRQGVTLKEVADVLGHARLETTAIYAKLHLDTLRSVALPWPGVMP